MFYQQTFGMQLGQPLALMGLDANNKVRRAEVSLATPREATGSFDVVLYDTDSDFLVVGSLVASIEARRCAPV